MASSKDYLEYILDQLSGLDDVSYRAMMGEYIIYYRGNAKYVPVVEQTAKEQGVPFKAIHIKSKTEAQSAPTPVTTYALFFNGEYITNEQMNAARFLKLLSQRGTF